MAETKHALFLRHKTYVKIKFTTLLDTQFFTSFEKEFFPELETSIGIAKIFTKYLVCKPSVSAATEIQMYIKKCIKKHLIPFVR